MGGVVVGNNVVTMNGWILGCICPSICVVDIAVVGDDDVRNVVGNTVGILVGYKVGTYDGFRVGVLVGIVLG